MKTIASIEADYQHRLQELNEGHQARMKELGRVEESMNAALKSGDMEAFMSGLDESIRVYDSGPQLHELFV
jgi:hypothetical protein